MGSTVIITAIRSRATSLKLRETCAVWTGLQSGDLAVQLSLMAQLWISDERGGDGPCQGQDRAILGGGESYEVGPANGSPAR